MCPFWHLSQLVLSLILVFVILSKGKSHIGIALVSCYQCLTGTVSANLVSGSNILYVLIFYL